MVEACKVISHKGLCPYEAVHWGLGLRNRWFEAAMGFGRTITSSLCSMPDVTAGPAATARCTQCCTITYFNPEFWINCNSIQCTGLQEKVCRLLAFLCTRWTGVNCTKYSVCLQLLQLEEVMSLRHQLKRLTTSDRVTLVVLYHQAACTRKAGWSRTQDFVIKL